MRPVCLLLALAVLVCTPSAAIGEQVATTVAPETSPATHDLLHMQAPKAGTGFAYDLQTAGSITITQSGSRQEQSVSLFAGLELRWDAETASRLYPARLNLVAPHLSVGGKERLFEQEPGMLATGFDAHGQILWAQTPTRLRELGLDLTQLLLGISVPSPFTHLLPGAAWTANAVLGDPTAKDASFDIRTTYTFVGFEERRRHVYALVRGSILLTPKNPPTRHSYVGRLEAYLDPATGRVVESATSLDVQAKLQLPGARADVTEEASVRMVLTTYLLDLGPASAAPTSATPPPSIEPARPETPRPPVISVGQPKTEPLDPEEPVLTTAPVPPSESTDEEPPEQITPTPVVIQIMEPKSPPTPMRTVQSGAEFVDPAGRFSITLPLGWESKTYELTADTTSFAGPTEPQMIYVFVDQAEPGSLGSFARSVLGAYASSSEQFRLRTDLQPISMGDVPAFVAHYAYPQAATGEMVEELVFFGRYEDFNYVLQYSGTPEHISAQKVELIRYFSNAFRLGPTPDGTVPVSFLTSSGTRLHVDGQRRYSLEIPNLWPVFFRAEDDSSITFAELGKNGYLTIYAQDGMERHTPDSVLRSWRGQWIRQEQGFKELTPMQPATLSGYSAATMSYEWINSDGRVWQRRVVTTIQQGMLYAVVMDYVAAGAPDKAGVFAHTLNSFRIPQTLASIPAQSSQKERPTPSTTVPSEPSAAGDGVLTATGRISLASQVRLEEPLSSTRVLLVGRLGERIASEIRWLSGVTIRMRVGQSVYAARTDANGYFAFANAAPVTSGAYVLLGAEGPMLGYNETVNVAFSGVQVTPGTSRLVEAGHIVMELVNGGALHVTQALPQSLPDPRELPRYFLTNYAESGWTSVLRSALTHP